MKVEVGGLGIEWFPSCLCVQAEHRDVVVGWVQSKQEVFFAGGKYCL